jgi:hypothetical protein
MVIKSSEPCESCGKVIDPVKPATTLEGNFINDARRNLYICSDCFKKRYKTMTKKRSGYAGTIYELEERAPPRFGLGSQTFSCLKCNWVAWTDVGLIAHMRRRHKQ